MKTPNIIFNIELNLIKELKVIDNVFLLNSTISKSSYSSFGYSKMFNSICFRRN